MKDASLSVAEMLSEKWDGDGFIHKGRVTIRRGEPEDLSKRFVDHPVSIEATKLAGYPRRKTRTKVIIKEVVPVNIMILISNLSKKNVSDMRDELQRCVDEIYDVVEANDTMFEDIRFVYVQAERFFDLLEDDTPTIKATLELLCIYSRGES